MENKKYKGIENIKKIKQRIKEKRYMQLNSFLDFMKLE